MARIGAYLSGIERSLLNRLAEANAASALHSLRAATGRRIQTPSDDPGKFIALSRLQVRLNVAAATMSNVTAATSIVTQTQSTLDAIRDELAAIRAELAADEGRTLSVEERAEAQANIDASITRINQLAATRIDGRRVLDGSADFQVSGRRSEQVSRLVVRSLGSRGYDGSPVTVYGTVLTAATQAELTYTGSGGTVTDTGTFVLAGDRGEAAFSVTADEDLDDVAQRINQYSHQTGVTASVDGDELTLTSVAYGSRSEIAITSETLTVTGGNGDATANGTDAEVTINGLPVSGAGVVDGNRVSVHDNGRRFEIEFAEGFAGDFAPITVSGSAMTFALSTDPLASSTLAVPGVQAERLGGLSGTIDMLASGGEVSGLDGNTSRALRIVDEALGRLTRLQGHVDGFHNASVSSASAALDDLQQQLQDSIDAIDEPDTSEDLALAAHYQALASNAQAGLAIVYQQRASVVAMIQQIAGRDP